MGIPVYKRLNGSLKYLLIPSYFYLEVWNVENLAGGPDKLLFRGSNEYKKAPPWWGLFNLS
jgi:hypothetical protein